MWHTNLGSSNSNRAYHLSGSTISAVESVSELGIIIAKDFKWVQCITSVTKKASWISFVIQVRKTFKVMNSNNLCKDYTSLITLHLESARPIWCLLLKKDISLVEKIQWKFTNASVTLSNLPCKNQLHTLNLSSYWTYIP